MEAIVCIGASASGKTYWTNNFLSVEANAVKAREYIRNNPDILGNLNYRNYPVNVNWININRDKVRFEEFCDGVYDWGRYRWKHEGKVTDICNSQIENAAKEGKNIIISDTNLNPKYRNTLIKKLEELGYDVEIKEFDVPLEELYRRDRLRPNSVGESVIYKQWLQWLEYKGHKKYEPDTFLKDCVICDIDGTIASMEGVRGPFEWHRVKDDKPISTVMDVVDGLYKMGYSVVFLSGRDGVCYNDTKEWLEQYFKFPIELYMRAAGDTRKDHVIKRELFFKHVADKYNVRLILDDRISVIENCWTPLGIKVINCGRINERF